MSFALRTRKNPVRRGGLQANPALLRICLRCFVCFGKRVYSNNWQARFLCYESALGAKQEFKGVDDLVLRRAGEEFRIGEDLYGVSVAQLEARLEILTAEHARISREIDKKRKEKSEADQIFKK